MLLGILLWDNVKITEPMLHNSQTDNIIRTKMRSSPWILLTYEVHLHKFHCTNKCCNSMWQRPTWEAKRLSVSQDVPSIPYYFKLKCTPLLIRDFWEKKFCKQIHCTACKIYYSFCEATCSSWKILFETFKEWKIITQI
jgi:hypothetical protein